MSRAGQPLILRHRPTTLHLIALNRIEEYANDAFRFKGATAANVVGLKGKEGSISYKRATVAPACGAIEQLDGACLDLSIALLDHELRGDLFESPLIGYMAAIGVDAENQNNVTRRATPGISRV